MVGADEDTPDLEPLFINHWEAIRVESDVFVDLGIIKPEELLTVRPGPDGRSTEVNFYVLQRVVMNVNTFNRFIAQGPLLVAGMESKGARE